MTCQELSLVRSARENIDPSPTMARKAFSLVSILSIEITRCRLDPRTVQVSASGLSRTFL